MVVYRSCNEPKLLQRSRPERSVAAEPPTTGARVAVSALHTQLSLSTHELHDIPVLEGKNYVLVSNKHAEPLWSRYFCLPEIDYRESEESPHKPDRTVHAGQHKRQELHI